MNTQDLIDFVEKQTGRAIDPPNLTRYIKKGVLVVERTYQNDTGYFENDYSLQAAHNLVRYLTSFSVTRARFTLGHELNINVTWDKMVSLCEAYPEWTLPITDGRMTRIPAEHLVNFADVLQAEMKPVPEPVSVEDARAVVEALQCVMTLEQIADAVKSGEDNISPSYLSHMKAGRRAMSKELYDRLVSLRANTL